jgi:predicted alpha/beta superfamily hydrolase
MNKIIITLLFSITSIGFCFGQEPLVLGEIHHIQSKTLSEKRTLNIYTPQGYNPDSNKTYPVIYLLDGSANEDFIHIVGLVQFLNMNLLMPETIVVGIANVDRKRDFTFPTTIKKDKEDFPTTGSSAKFINFIANELQPYVEKSYKVNSSKTIIGQSLGGLLATEILLKNGKLFNNYIIVSPSLWWDDQSLLKNADTLINNQKLINTKVFVAVGEEGKVMKDDAKKLAELATKAKDLTVNFEFFEKEDHATILHSSIYQTLLKMYPKKK